MDNRMSIPLVSVLTSCYNETRYLPEAVESILNQSFSNFEFILIDDGSTDDTNEIIKKYADLDDRIVPVYKSNSGLTDSLNIGIEKAKGEWIARIDADDIALPDRLTKQIQFIRKNENTVLLGTGCVVIDEMGNSIKEYKYPLTHSNFVKHIEKGGSPFPHSSTFYRRDIIESLGGYRNRVNGAEDLDLWLRIISLGQINCLEEPLIKLRKHSQSITARNDLLVYRYMARVSHKLRKQGVLDPIDQDDVSFKEFFSLIDDYLEEEGIKRMIQEWTGLRSQWYSPSRKTKVKSVITLLGSYSGKRMLLHKILGIDIAKNITKLWVDYVQKEREDKIII